MTCCFFVYHENLLKSTSFLFGSHGPQERSPDSKTSNILLLIWRYTDMGEEYPVAYNPWPWFFLGSHRVANNRYNRENPKASRFPWDIPSRDACPNSLFRWRRYPSTMRKSAVEAMCMMCDEGEIGGWRNKYSNFWYEGRCDVYEKRYKLLGEEEQYWMIRNAGNFLRTSSVIGRLREHKSYVGKPEESIAWNTMCLNILDGITQNTIPDGWICEYCMQYIKLSAAYFGLND